MKNIDYNRLTREQLDADHTFSQALFSTAAYLGGDESELLRLAVQKLYPEVFETCRRVVYTYNTGDSVKAAAELDKLRNLSFLPTLYAHSLTGLQVEIDRALVVWFHCSYYEEIARVMFNFDIGRLLPGYEYKDHQRTEAV